MTIDPPDGAEHHDHSVQVAADKTLKVKWATSGAAKVHIENLSEEDFDASGEQPLPTKEASYVLYAIADGGAKSMPWPLEIHVHDASDVVSPHTDVGSGVLAVVSFVAQAAGGPVTKVVAGTLVDLIILASDEAEKAKIGEQEIELVDTGDGHKQGKWSTTVKEEISFEAFVLKDGTQSDKLSLQIEIIQPTTTTTAAAAGADGNAPAATPSSTTTKKAHQAPVVAKFAASAPDGSSAPGAEPSFKAGAQVHLEWEVSGDFSEIEIDQAIGSVLAKTAPDDGSGKRTGSIDVDFKPQDQQTELTWNLTLTPADPKADKVTASVAAKVIADPMEQPPQILEFKVAPGDGSAQPAAEISAQAATGLVFSWKVSGAFGALDIDNGVGEVTDSTDPDDGSGQRSGTFKWDLGPAGDAPKVVYTLTLTPKESPIAPITATVTVKVQTGQVNPHKDAHIFDATGLTWWKDDLCNLAASTPKADRSKNLSLEFGLRMYKELLKWELTPDGSGGYSGVKYSVDPLKGGGLPAAYNKIRKNFLSMDVITNKKKGTKSKRKHSEWPDTLPFLPDDTDTVTVTEGTFKHVYVFGIWWVLSGNTNCSNSQIAAFTAAQPDGKIYVRKEKGKDPVVYNCFGEDGQFDVTDINGGSSSGKYSAQRIFENSFVQVNQWKLGGVTAFSKSGKGPIEAFQILGLGTFLGDGELSEQDKNYRLARLGDHASSSGHAFMVGDVVYEVTFQGKGESPWLVLQSSFAKGNGELAAKPDGTPYSDPDDIDYREKSLTADDCDKLIDDEKTFLDKVDKFLAKNAGDTLEFDPQGRKIKAIKVKCVVQFSANTRLRDGMTTVCGTFYRDDGTEDDKTKAMTKQFQRINGISRAPGEKKAVVFGRFYGHSD